MAELDPGEVVVRAQRGDRGALEALVRRYLRPAYLVALAVVRVPAEAEDVAQEAVAMAMQQLETCRDPARFAGWLMANVRNRALNRLAAAKVRLRHADQVRGEEAVAGDAERVVLRQQLLLALEVLTPQQREVVLLHDLEAWTHPEIAAALGLSEVNSRQVLSTARRALRAKLEALEVTHG
jgi:RNA polymerase sigma-70 factor (ECF subfamily)